MYALKMIIMALTCTDMFPVRIYKKNSISRFETGDLKATKPVASTTFDDQ